MWYYASAGSSEGPFQEDYLGRKLRAGVINKDTLVWTEGMADWLPLAQTELAQLLNQQVPWQTTPRYEPPQPQTQPPADEHCEYDVDSAHDPLEDYEQSGLEESQLHRQASAAHGEAGGEAWRRRACQVPSVSEQVAWKNLSTLTHALTVLLGLLALFSLWHFVTPYVGFHPVFLESSLVPHVYDLVDSLHLLTRLVFLIWFYQSMRNLQSLGVRSLSLSPVLVTFSFFVPYISLFVPYMAMRKLWRASFAPKAWTAQRVSRVVTVLWFGWLFGSHGDRGVQIYWFWSEQYLSRGDSDLYQYSLPELLNLATFIAAIIFVNAIWRAQQVARAA